MKARQHPTTGDPRSVRRAWWSFLLFVPSLVAAFVVGEGLLAAQGYDEGDSPPLGVVLAAGLPAILVFALPMLLVWHFGRRAQRNGDAAGRTPVIVALVLLGGFLAMNLLPLAVALVL